MDPPVCPKRGGGGWLMYPKEQPELSGLAYSLPPSLPLSLLQAAWSWPEVLAGWVELSLQDHCPGSPRQAQWGLTLPGHLFPSQSLSLYLLPPSSFAYPLYNSTHPCILMVILLEMKHAFQTHHIQASFHRYL